MATILWMFVALVIGIIIGYVGKWFQNKKLYETIVEIEKSKENDEVREKKIKEAKKIIDRNKKRIEEARNIINRNNRLLEKTNIGDTYG
jgi:uncharacterized membrane-anchored protein YhcB (DUF1043 family)